VGPTPTDPVEFRKCARDLNTLSAAQKHTNEERGGGDDPGVRRPGAGRGLSCQHARTSFVPHCFSFCLWAILWLKNKEFLKKRSG